MSWKRSISMAVLTCVILLSSNNVLGDQCKDNLDRCARVRPQQGFTYEIGNKPVFQWVADLLLIDPSEASAVCRDWPFYVNTLTCMRNRIKEYVCWGQSKYYWTDRYIPDEKTLKASMQIFCDPAKREEKKTMNDCMLLNARENKKKEECLREEEAKAAARFGSKVNDNSMCSFFHKRLNCYRIYFGSICKTTLLENTNVFNAITMDEYFDPLRKSSICHIIEGAGSLTACVVLLVSCVIVHWFL